LPRFDVSVVLGQTKGMLTFQTFAQSYFPLLLVIALCWLLATIGVACDIVLARRWKALGWIPLTLVFGPLAAGAFVMRWNKQQKQIRRINRRFLEPQPRLPALAHTLPQDQDELVPFKTRPASTGLYLLVRQGAMQDAHRSYEIPLSGMLVVRRASKTNERGGLGELVLHDRAVSRGQHCFLMLEGGNLVLEDTSSNGTIVNDQLVLHDRVALQIGTIIQVGSSSLLLCDEREIFPTAVNR
jgi:hypothetical protein